MSPGPPAAAAPARSGRSSAAPARSGRSSAARDSGLVALEWLLIVALAASLGALTSVIVRRVITDASEVPADPLVRLLEADVAAASLAAQAQSEYDSDQTAAKTDYAAADAQYQSRCEAGIPGGFSDVVASAAWKAPTGLSRARCEVTPHPDLGG